MLYVMLRDGSVKEVQGADSARIENGQLVFRDPRGLIVHRIDAELVNAYGKHDALRRAAHH
jgi:hypothetical protein